MNCWSSGEAPNTCYCSEADNSALIIPGQIYISYPAKTTKKKNKKGGDTRVQIQYSYELNEPSPATYLMVKANCTGTYGGTGCATDYSTTCTNGFSRSGNGGKIVICN